MKINNIIVQPLITEKATGMAQAKVYAFEVSIAANKHQIAQAMKTIYGVEVGEIKTITRKGKIKKVGRQMKPKKRSDKKIAYITLKKGTIDLFPQN